MAENGVALAVDMGGTNLRVAVVDENGVIGRRWQVRAEAELGREQLVAKLADLLGQAAEHARGQGGEIRGVGLGFPGILSPARDMVLESPNLRPMEMFPLVEFVRQTTGLPVVLDNDANAWAVGEAWLGAGRGMRDFALYTLGSGIGGGIVLNGRVWRGARSQAGELGHVKVVAGGRTCGCGGRGCVEAYTSGANLLRRVREALEEGRQTSLGEGDLTLPNIGRALERECRAGDALAVDLMESIGYYLGLLSANLINALDLEGIILGGGIARALELFEEVHTRTMKENVLYGGHREVRVVPAELGGDAGLLGMARVAFDECGGGAAGGE